MADPKASSQATADNPGDASPLRLAMADCRKAFGLMAFISFMTNILGIVPTLYMMNMYDRVLTSRSGVTMVSLVLLVIGIYLFWSGLEWIRNRIMLRISLRIDWDLADRAFDASFRRNASRRKNNIQQVMGDLLTLRQFLTGRPMISVIDAPVAIIYIIVGGLIHPYLAVFALASTLLVTGMALLNRKIATPALRAANEASNEATRLASQCLRHSETALAMGMLPAIRLRWHEKHRWFLQNQINGSEASGIIGWVSGVITKLTPSLQMALGIFLAVEGHITGGMVIAATFLINRSVSPLKALINNWKDVVNARVAFERLDELMQEDIVRESRMSLPAPKGRITVQGLALKAPGSGRIILKGVTIALEPGQMVAVVGPNGAGKSSLLKALLGLWRPESGSVRIDGVEVSDWDHDELGPHIGYVQQDAELFEATVAENIARLGKPDAERVVKAAKIAGIHDLILSFPQGYDTVLSDSAHAVSGGQAQRIAIARALYGDPAVLVLDEPNAKLDDTAETELMAMLQLLRSQGTAIVFSTHRPRLLAMADFMLLLKGGEQVGFGPVREMISHMSERKKDKPELSAVSAGGVAGDTSVASAADAKPKVLPVQGGKP